MNAFDVCVRGSGIVGRCLALALAREGLRVALEDAPARAGGAVDVRAYALNPASVALLQRLRAWEALPPGCATPVYDMHVAGDAPGAALDFSAYQQRVRELAWIVDASALEAQLASAVRFAPHVTVVPAGAPVSCRLTALAEGRDSAGLKALGVPLERHDYRQSAIAARLVAARAHTHRAWQWFRSPDVLALLPFDRPQAGRSYALVWSLPSSRADELMRAAPEDFEAALDDVAGTATGGLKLASERASWPLAIARAGRWSGQGWVLLGDSAHVVHPLAGQGLNLGLADVATLARVIAEREPWRDIGDEKLLRRYERRRLGPTRAMGLVIDGLWHLFARDTPGLRELRNGGLNLVDHLPGLKRWLTARALEH
jgi:2-polyprenyl-6-methoxyphenol hydroxylase-like FAD-dependent oxidoreductase